MSVEDLAELSLTSQIRSGEVTPCRYSSDIMVITLHTSDSTKFILDSDLRVTVITTQYIIYYNYMEMSPSDASSRPVSKKFALFLRSSKFITLFTS
jgi:hypothetical protein